jgi:hypothetical protein
VATPDDLYAVVAGDPGASSLGDGGSALDAALHVTDVDVGPDGSIYVAGGGPLYQQRHRLVRRIFPDVLCDSRASSGSVRCRIG